MITLGLASLIFASFRLYRRDDIKRPFAYSSIEHMGIITFAFGMGGPLASFAGLLHMTMHSLTKSAIFFAVGHVAQVKGTQKIAKISGLTECHPLIGWGLVAGVMAIAGLPPFGIFMSEFLVVSSTFARQPLLAIPPVFGLLVAFGALPLRLIEMAFGEPTGRVDKIEVSVVPLFAHLSLVLLAGLNLAPHLVAWFQNVARLLGYLRRAQCESLHASGSCRVRSSRQAKRMPPTKVFGAGPFGISSALVLAATISRGDPPAVFLQHFSNLRSSSF